MTTLPASRVFSDIQLTVIGEINVKIHRVYLVESKASQQQY